MKTKNEKTKAPFLTIHTSKIIKGMGIKDSKVGDVYGLEIVEVEGEKVSLNFKLL